MGYDDKKPLNSALQKAIGFAYFCQRTKIDPRVLALIMQASDSYARAGERLCGALPESQKRRARTQQHQASVQLDGLCASINWTWYRPGLWPEWTRPDRQRHVGHAQ